MLQLFEDQAVRSIGKPKPIRSAVWSFVIHLTAVVFVLSLGFSPVLPIAPGNLVKVWLVAPQPPPPPLPPPPPIQATAVPQKRVVRAFTAVLTAPVAVPRYRPSEDTAIETPPDLGVIGGVPGGVPGGIPGGVLAAVPVFNAPPPVVRPAVVRAPEPPPVQAAPQRIAVDPEIQEAQLLVMVRPVYPDFAKRARIQGAVRLSAIIDRDGRITSLKLIEGHSLLAPAALAAVQQWRYRPTLLNGEAVEVITQVIVKFRLETNL